MNRPIMLKRSHRFGLLRETLLVMTVIAAALIVAVILLVCLGDTGLRFAIAAPLGFGLISAAMLIALPAYPYARFGLANTLTTLRAGLTTFIGAMLFEGERLNPNEPGLAWLITAVAATALILDGLDGRAARATRSSSRFGARFDMEIDALLILLLCGLLWVSGKLGPWILALGSMRYGFGVARLLSDRLNGELTESRRRKTVCVVQGVVLCVALAPIVPAPVAAAITAVALFALAYSFAVDIVDLVSRRC